MRRLFMAALAFTLVSGPAMADALADLLARGTIRLGVRDDAPPFSIKRPDGSHAGYQVDLCRAVVESISREAGRPLAVSYVTVDAGNRFRLLAEGAFDLLCEPSSITLGRREMVDFSIPTFVTGAGLMGRLTPGPIAVPPLGGGGVGMPAQPPRRLGVLAGTTTETAVRGLVSRGLLSAQVIEVSSHGEGVTALSAGLLDGYAADLEILVDLRARTTSPESFVIADRLLTLETYGIGLKRGESALRLAVDRAIARHYRDGSILQIAERHFPGRAPGDAFTAMVLLNAFPE